MYTSEKLGNDESGDGTEGKPFKTILQAMRAHGAEPFPTIYVDSTEDDIKFKPAAKSQLKKIHKLWVRDQYKQAEKLKKEDDDAEKRTKNMQEAKKIVIVEDKSLPPATKIKIQEGKV